MITAGSPGVTCSKAKTAMATTPITGMVASRRRTISRIIAASSLVYHGACPLPLAPRGRPADGPEGILRLRAAAQGRPAESQAGSQAGPKDRARGIRRRRPRDGRSAGHRRPERDVGMVLAEPVADGHDAAEDAARARRAQRLDASHRRPARGRSAGLSAGYFFCCCATAASAAWKPILLCVPSQKGFVTDAPQRQSAKRGPRLLVSTLVPLTSTSSTSPSTR